MADSKTVAIHQPNFFPWLGYFDKIARADLFLVMDNVQYPKKGGTWSNRVRLLVNGGPAWVTMPVVRAYHGVRSYGEIQTDGAAPWRDKLLKTLRANYQRSPFFESVYPHVEGLVNNPTDSLTEYNLSAVTSLAGALGLDTSKIVLGSALGVGGAATDLLVAMVEAAGGTAYLCGGGALYQQDEKFGRAGIRLVYQDFKHPVYPQHNAREFVAGLSIIDALMNCGFERTGAMVSAAAATAAEVRQ